MIINFYSNTIIANSDNNKLFFGTLFNLNPSVASLIPKTVNVLGSFSRIIQINSVNTFIVICKEFNMIGSNLNFLLVTII